MNAIHFIYGGWVVTTISFACFLTIRKHEMITGQEAPSQDALMGKGRTWLLWFVPITMAALPFGAFSYLTKWLTAKL